MVIIKNKTKTKHVSDWPKAQYGSVRIKPESPKDFCSPLAQNTRAQLKLPIYPCTT